MGILPDRKKTSISKWPFCFSSHPNRKKSFTLIELLVVVAIIAVLVAMLLPALTNARENARVITCSNNLRQLMLAQIHYSNMYNAYAGYQPWGAPPIDLLYDYLIREKLLDTWYTPVGKPVNKPPYVCPNVPPAIALGSGNYSGISQPYGWNWSLGGWVYGQPGDPYFSFRRPDRIETPSMVVGWSETESHGCFFPTSIYWSNSRAPIVLRHGRGEKAYSDDVYSYQFETGNFANGMCLDGHYQRIDTKEVRNNYHFWPEYPSTANQLH
jgi:prepilin-type N-terminal cleavage/methylation domain-containing protein